MKYELKNITKNSEEKSHFYDKVYCEKFAFYLHIRTEKSDNNLFFFFLWKDVIHHLCAQKDHYSLVFQRRIKLQLSSIVQFLLKINIKVYLSLLKIVLLYGGSVYVVHQKIKSSIDWKENYRKLCSPAYLQFSRETDLIFLDS